MPGIAILLTSIWLIVAAVLAVGAYAFLDHPWSSAIETGLVWPSGPLLFAFTGIVGAVMWVVRKINFGEWDW